MPALLLVIPLPKLKKKSLLSGHGIDTDIYCNSVGCGSFEYLLVSEFLALFGVVIIWHDSVGTSSYNTHTQNTKTKNPIRVFKARIIDSQI